MSKAKLIIEEDKGDDDEEKGDYEEGEEDVDDKESKYKKDSLCENYLR